MRSLRESEEKANQEAQLFLSNVTVTRGNRTLIKNLNFSIPRGKFIAVVGPSGAGKTSLLHCLAGMVPIQEGQITYHCKNYCAHTPSSFRSKMGLVFQNLRLIRNASVLSNVLSGSLGRRSWWQTLLGFSSDDQVKATELIMRLELSSYAHQYVSKISGGEQQRTALARALMQEPEIILADEPVSHLDQRLAEQIVSFLRHETHQKGRTVLCILHDFNLVKQFSDLILFLDKKSPSNWRLEINENNFVI